MAVTQRVLTDNAYGTKVLINFDDHGSAVTIDASALANKENSGDRLDIKKVSWSLDTEVAITFTGSGTTEAIDLAGGTTGSFDAHVITNAATQPGDATDADIVLTPGSNTDGFVYLELIKSVGFGN
tara:strand:- start:829 stop:1206 length:378 start_codon:yes stop_codon:yes gene_type:complete